MQLAACATEFGALQYVANSTRLLGMERMKSMSTILVGVILLGMLLSSCATGHQARKCNGKRAIQTPMGPM